MARIPYYNPETAEQKVRDFFSSLPQLNIFKMLGNAGLVGRDFVRFGSTILLKGKLDPVLRELAIIRTGLVCGSKYEVHQHLAIARRMKIPEEKIAALEEGSSSPAFSEIEKLAVRMAEEIAGNAKASDATFESMARRLEPGHLAELVIAIGYYMMVSCFLETFEVEIES
ncbi:MAG: carboxymuconolactone decarboxylase family protein [Spirochaetes bacterium]|nr:carboxymuconolactone decarboxylase family protein [Spirochaetota bacterium]